MLNLFQHLIKSIGYETLKQVQGDRKKTFARGSPVSQFSKTGKVLFGR